MNIYLDNASTTPLKNNVKKYLIDILDIYGNPSSLHSIGEKAKQIIEQTRKSIAKFINANTDEIYFTSGGAASNSLGIKGFCQKHTDCQIFYSPTVHKSILNITKSGCVSNKIYSLKVDHNGMIDINDLEQSIIGRKPFVVIEYANSEIGSIQNVKEIIDTVHFYKGIVYLDCTGSIPTIPLDVKKLDIDICGFSAHKLGGLKGCGVLYKKKNIELEPLVYGSQEKGIFGGTENVLGIASLGKAVEDYDYSSISSEDRDYVWNYIKNNIPEAYLVGSPFGEYRLSKNLNICFPKCEAESLMILLDMDGICVSVGSACSSGELTPSSTLVAIGIKEQDIHSCIRISFGKKLNIYELDYICKSILKNVNKLKELTYG